MANNKYKWLALMSAATVSVNVSSAEKDERNINRPPNIIIIFCDDLGYGDIGINGHPTIRTPNLDRMAINGIRFTNYYSASPASTASRYALLTGRYPSRSGFRWVLPPGAERGIHPNEITLAEALREQGYSTAIFGKWHLGDRKEFLPLQHGFDRFLGFPYSNDMLPPRHPDLPLIYGNDVEELNPDQTLLTERFTREAIAFIKENRENPFFIYLPYTMPHVPLLPGDAFRGVSRRGLYGDTVEEIDWAVGEILNTLRELGIAENTIVWFTSDNGPWLIMNEEGGSSGLFRDGKGSTWEGGVRVPCFVYWPGRIQPGVNMEMVRAMDIFTTSLWLAGAEIPTDRVIDGRNIAYFLGFEDAPPVEDVPHFFFGQPYHQLMAVRYGTWKLHVRTTSQLRIEHFDGRVPLLFNINEDPSEKFDLSEQFPEIVEELKLLIENKQKEVLSTGSFFD
jgi:arylsulfatase